MGQKSIKIRSKDYGLFIDLPDGTHILYDREAGECVWHFGSGFETFSNAEIKDSKLIIKDDHQTTT